jgi:hypothetical protein
MTDPETIEPTRPWPTSPWKYSATGDQCSGSPLHWACVETAPDGPASVYDVAEHVKEHATAELIALAPTMAEVFLMPVECQYDHDQRAKRMGEVRAELQRIVKEYVPYVAD